MRDILRRPWKWGTSTIVIAVILVTAVAISFYAPPRGEILFDWKGFSNTFGFLIYVPGFILLHLVWNKIRGKRETAN